MARIAWTREALHNIELIRAYIQQFDPGAAQRMAQKLIEAGNSLSDFPDRGRPVAGRYRELPIVPPYVIRYRVDAGRVLILRIRHGRQDQP
jgi:addiction module RelE/StbE family toxin